MPVPVPELPNVIPAHPCPITTTIIILLITIATIIVFVYQKNVLVSTLKPSHKSRVKLWPADGSHTGCHDHDDNG